MKQLQTQSRITFTVRALHLHGDFGGSRVFEYKIEYTIFSNGFVWLTHTNKQVIKQEVWYSTSLVLTVTTENKFIEKKCNHETETRINSTFCVNRKKNGQPKICSAHIIQTKSYCHSVLYQITFTLSRQRQSNFVIDTRA